MRRRQGIFAAMENDRQTRRASAWLWGEMPIYLFALCGLATCVVLWRAYNVNFDPVSVVMNFQLFAGFLIFLGSPLLILRLIREKPDSPITWVFDHFRSSQWRRRILVSLPVLAICIAIIPAFSTIKSMIPLFTDYDWDATFMAWDRALLFGNDAWVLLQPLLGYPILTAGIAVIYHLWMLLLYAGILFMLWSGRVDYDTRRQFFLTYCMAWPIVGGAMATYFASVGPVFVEPILGIRDFVPQTDYLAAANDQIPIMVVSVQELLVESFQASDRGLGKGISAMPSMHVAICVLYWLAARQISPVLARFFFWFMIVIWIGSVHTAYHYAVDGLVSLIAVVALWWLAKGIFAAWDCLPVPFGQPTLRTNTVPAE